MGKAKKKFDEVKKHSRTSPDVQFKEFSFTKQKTRSKTDYGWIGKNHLKKFDPKNRKTVKIKVKLPHVNKKPLANFCSNTVFSLYFKFRAKKIHAEKPLALLHFLFQRDQNHYSNLTSKIMKMCEQILKKHSGTSPEKQFKELNKKFRRTQPDQHIN